MKLIEVISAGVGRVSKYYFGKLDAKAFELEKIAGTQAYEVKNLKNALGEHSRSCAGKYPEHQRNSICFCISLNVMNKRAANVSSSSFDIKI